MTEKLPPFKLARIDALKPYPRNARTHSRKQIGQIADSIHEFGFTNPVLIDENNQIIAGHGRIEAARLLDIDKVPTLRIEHLTDAQKRAYILADNKIAENAGWCPEILAIELEGLLTLEPEFDIEITGFEMAEIDVLIGASEATGDDDDVVPATDPDRPTVSRIGDLWLLGRHKLYCGDARDAKAYQALLGDEKAQMVFTDPPYNVAIDGHVSGLGKTKHGEFVCASGEMSQSQFTEFLATVFGHMAVVSRDGAIHFVCMDWRHLAEIQSAGRGVYSELKNLCIWNKNNGGMGSLYRSKHELIFVYKHGTAPHINNVQLGRHGRYRTNVWDYAGASSFSTHRDDDLAMHPTVKPTAMIADAILDCSKRNGVILDPFGGSGSTLIAAERTGRSGRLIELDPTYTDIIIRRFQDLTGAQASLAASGDTFGETAIFRQPSEDLEAAHEQAQ